MAYDHDFDDMLPQTVVVTTRSGHSAYGTATYAASGSTYRARVVAKPSFIRGLQGENVAVKSVVWIASTGTIDPSDRITLPDGTTPPVLGVESYPDEDGASYFSKVMLGF
jgi:hypothetical protein